MSKSNDLLAAYFEDWKGSEATDLHVMDSETVDPASSVTATKSEWAGDLLYIAYCSSLAVDPPSVRQHTNYR